MIYNTQHIINRLETGENLKYLFFWGHRKSYKVTKTCLSQWYETPFTVNDITYLTAEHWMMAQKAILFEDKKTYKLILECKTPGEAKDLGRRILGFDEQTWIDNRIQIVISGNFHKFMQHPELKKFLVETKNRILVEASPVDKIWGIGLAQDNADVYIPQVWQGLNLLGFALMSVRDLILVLDSVKLEEIILPPWLQYPEIDRFSIGWRMGYGETHIMNLSAYFKSLTDKQMQLYQVMFPALGEWKGWYKS